MIARAAPCPLCHHDDVSHFSAIAADIPSGRERTSINECGECGLAWQYPVPRAEHESAEYFAQHYDAAEAGTYFDPGFKSETVASEYKILEELDLRPGRLLDIGCGDGTFVRHAAAKGWQCLGLDPAAAEGDGQPPEQGSGSVRISGSTLDDLDVSEKFDVITLWDVIEHVSAPLEMISGAVKHLADDGLLMLETGNYQSAERILNSETWWAFQADHRWYFSPPTLLELLNFCDLPHVALANRVARPGWNGSVSFEGPSLRAHLKRIVRSPGAAPKTVRRFLDLRAASAQWPHWAGLGIFTLVASREEILSGPTPDFHILS